ncbi:LysR family transcriptional regulator [Microbispora sp. H10949]|uniref:LysR family transcriptional regulator n=1 Tax=Microbispora sp. H10949 TaxID=2729111 RepID=UPI0021760D31|nr:LysR family transcriptional regulator [Microbispora sp. H10949]
MLSSHRLRVLLEVFRTGSIAGAAKTLRLSPSAVSHQLARLEEEAGVGLVERAAHSLRLTAAGRRLAGRAQEVLDLIESAEKDLLAQARADAGQLRIGFFASAGYRLLPMALSSFTARHPGVDLDLVLGQPHELLADVERGELDVLVVFEHALDPWKAPKGVEVVHLFDEPQLLVMPLGHPAGHRPRVRLADLADDPWITTFGTETPVSVLERASALEGFTPAIRCRSDHYEVTLGLVRAGLGVALVPSLGVQGAAGVQVCQVEGPRLYRRVGAAIRPTNPNPALRAFVGYLRDASARLSVTLRQGATERPAARGGGPPDGRSPIAEPVPAPLTPLVPAVHLRHAQRGGAEREDHDAGHDVVPDGAGGRLASTAHHPGRDQRPDAE